ncbi:GNAT family N-acetyltransferase [Actinoplanes solisilvae]|uniref:GNAT family N-acetyltransferase n=1 Tax=Actinoplanes solisilvae TaxID=2486853 RepID=UPI001F0BDDB1|nr:GNAT family N-acetyltransferase [Actinoplanes solisilvae]
MTFPIPTGPRAWIEDVVVDEAVRGQGVGAALARRAVQLANGDGARMVDLTSRPARQAANQLYQRLGFRHATPGSSACRSRIGPPPCASDSVTPRPASGPSACPFPGTRDERRTSAARSGAPILRASVLPSPCHEDRAVSVPQNGAAHRAEQGHRAATVGVPAERRSG